MWSWRANLTVAAVTVVAVALAVIIFRYGFIWAAIIALVGFIAGRTLHRSGTKALPGRPAAAVVMFEWSIVDILSVAAIAESVGLVLAVVFDPQDSWSTEAKKLVAAAVGAITTFLTVTFVKDAAEADEKWIAKRTRSAFQDAYKGYFEAESRAANAVFAELWAGQQGWGPQARDARAAAVAEAMSGDD